MLTPLAIASDCISKRGGIFDFHKSSSWQSQGFYALGVDEQLGNTWYAEYGLDDLTFGTTGVILPGAIIGSINTTGQANTTQYLLGNFGLGVVPGNFNGSTPLSAISGLVEVDDKIPSHSYGYTAGAKYRKFADLETYCKILIYIRTKGCAQLTYPGWI